MRKFHLSSICEVLIFFNVLIFMVVFSGESQVKALTNQKVVFLTFDDGPSTNNTEKIIDILNSKNIKGTFFVIGKLCSQNPGLLRKLSSNGMSIGVHTYSHVYNEMYKDLDSYLMDFQKCREIIKNTIGEEPISYVRLPGGSSNLVSSVNSLLNIKRDLKQKGLKYVDWNVVSGDADSNSVDAANIEDNVVKGCQNKRLAVVLMHDAYYKTTTVEALPSIIDKLKKMGFVFKTFDHITSEEENLMIKMKMLNRN